MGGACGPAFASRPTGNDEHLTMNAEDKVHIGQWATRPGGPLFTFSRYMQQRHISALSDLFDDYERDRERRRPTPRTFVWETNTPPCPLGNVYDWKPD